MKHSIKNIRNTQIFLLILFVISCLPAQEITNEQDLRTFLDAKEKTYETVSIDMGKGYWNLYSGEEKPDLHSPKQRYFDLFNESKLNSVIEYWNDKKDNIKDRILKRRVEIWSNILTAAKVNFDKEIFELQTKLEDYLDVNYKGTDKPSPDELDKMTIELFKLRNAESRKIGYADYPELILSINGLGSEWFYDFIQKIYTGTKTDYENFLENYKKDNNKESIGFQDIVQFYIRYDGIKKGNNIDASGMSQLMKETVENIGIDYASLPIRFVEKPLPEIIGGQGIAVVIPSDFRAVVKPDLSFRDRMHEIGHGLQWMFTKTENPILKGYEWCRGSDCGGYAEGMAEIMARFTENPLWRKKYVNLTEEDLKKQREDLKKYFSAYIRFQLAVITAEIEIYKNLDKDPKEINNEAAKKYLLMDQPMPQIMRLANMMNVSYPVYVYGYLMGDMISWQVHTALKEKFGENFIFDKRVGDFLSKNLWETGVLNNWQENIKKATGEKLDIDGYLKHFGL